jgi:RNA polymerase sigma-70 factor (ECF subfamily)
MAETVTDIPVESDDAADVARARYDRQAFAPLYVRYFDRVYGYCYRRLGNADEAADATSVIFTRALAAIPTCNAATFRSWLFTIAHNTLADLYRQRRLDQSLDDALHMADQGPSPEEAALESEARAIVSGLLARLGEDQRSVIELRLAGLSSREIGEVLGKHPNAVDQLQFRAMTRLRALTGRGSAWTEGPR